MLQLPRVSGRRLGSTYIKGKDFREDIKSVARKGTMSLSAVSRVTHIKYVNFAHPDLSVATFPRTFTVGVLIDASRSSPLNPGGVTAPESGSVYLLLSLHNSNFEKVKKVDSRVFSFLFECPDSQITLSVFLHI